MRRMSSWRSSPLSHSIALALSLTRCLFLALSLSLACTLSLAGSLFLARPLYRSLSLYCSLSLALARSSLYPVLSRSRSLSSSLPLALALSLTRLSTGALERDAAGGGAAASGFEPFFLEGQSLDVAVVFAPTLLDRELTRPPTPHAH